MRSGRTTVDHVGRGSGVTDRALHLDTYQGVKGVSTFLTSTGDEADDTQRLFTKLKRVVP